MTRNRMGYGGMLAFGSCIAGSGFLFGALLALLFRHPNPPRWTRPEIVPMLICLPLTGMISVGLAYTVIGLWQLVNGSGDLLGLLTFAAVVIGLVLAWRGFGIRRRLNSYAPATGGFPASAYLAADPALVIDETSPPPPGLHTPPSGRSAA
jgi:heme A synthase